MRVLEEGDVQAGDEVVRIATGPEAMTIAEVNALLYLGRHHDLEQLRRALRIPALSPGWQDSLRALLDEEANATPGGGNAGLTTVAPPPAWPGFRTLRVAAKRSETTDVVALVLNADDGSALPTPRPGQSIALRLSPGPGSPPLVRSYSLSGSPADAGYRIGVKVESHGAAGHYIRERVQLGDRVEVSAPRGAFFLDDSERPVVLVSAGIGVTPMLAMLHALHDDHSPRDIWWVHGARNRSDHTFAEETATLLDDLEHVHRLVVYSRPGSTDRADADYDAIGHVTPELLGATGTPIDGEYYLCGPTAFMDTLGDGLTTLGVPAGRVHTEIFGAHDPITPGVVDRPMRTPHQPEGPPGSGPLITFVRSGLDVHWSDGNVSILELAEACDVPVRWSCRTGVCHTCETELVEGSVDYSPEPLDPPAEGGLLLCCSRPHTDLTIDL